MVVIKEAACRVEKSGLTLPSAEGTGNPTGFLALRMRGQHGSAKSGTTEAPLPPFLLTHERFSSGKKTDRHKKVGVLKVLLCHSQAKTKGAFGLCLFADKITFLDIQRTEKVS